MAKKKTKHKTLKSLLMIGIGSLATIGILCGIFFGIPGLQTKIADTMVDKSTIHQTTVDENEKLKEQNETKEKQIKNLTSDIQTKADTITGLNLQLTTIKQEKNTLESNLSSLQLDKDSLLKDMQEKDGKIDGYKTIISNLQSQLSTATNEKKELQEELNNSLEDNDILIEKINEKDNEINSLISVINSLNIQIDALNAIKEDYETKYLNALDEITSLKTQIETKDNEIKVLNNKITELNEQILLLQTKLNSMEASSTCNITFRETKYTYTPDGPGHIWLTANQQLLAMYDFTNNSYVKSLFLDKMQTKAFYGLNVLDYYDLTIDSIDYRTTFYKEYGSYVTDKTDFDYKIIDALGNEITNFDDLTDKINIGLKILDMEIAKDEETNNSYFKKLSVRLTVLNYYNQQSAYANSNSTLVLNSNRTFVYNGITGSYSRRNSEITLYANDGSEICAYLASDYSIVINNELLLAENAHNVKTTIVGDGKISLNSNYANVSGQTVEFTCSPNSGASVKSVTVCDVDGNALQLKNSNGTYSFAMADKDVKIVVQFEYFTIKYDSAYTHYYEEVTSERIKSTQITFSEDGTVKIDNKDENGQILSTQNGVYVVNNTIVIVTISPTGEETKTIIHFEIVDSNVIVNTDNNMTFSCA